MKRCHFLSKTRVDFQGGIDRRLFHPLCLTEVGKPKTSPEDIAFGKSDDSRNGDLPCLLQYSPSLALTSSFRLFNT